MYQKNVVKINSLFIIDRRRRKKHYDLFKDFNTLMYDHTLHHGRKYSCRYCWKAF